MNTASVWTGCRIRSVRKKGQEFGPKLMIFPNQGEIMRRRVLDQVKEVLSGHGDDIAGMAFVVWASDNGSTASLRGGPSSSVPIIAMPEFIKQRLIAEKIDDWSKEKDL